MAQKKRGRKKRTLRQFTPDDITLRIIGGSALAVTGLLALLSGVPGMNGSVFAALRKVTQGLGGYLPWLLPALLVWGGVLMILSTRRETKTRVWWLAFLAGVLLLTAVNLLSGGNGVRMLDDWKRHGVETYPACLSQAWNRQQAGGVVGMVLAWPLWRMLGAGFSGALCVLGILGALAAIFRNQVMSAVRMLKQPRPPRPEKQPQTARQNGRIRQPRTGEDWQNHPAYTEGRQPAADYGFQPAADEQFVEAPKHQIYTEEIPEAAQAQAAAAPARTSRIFGGRKKQPEAAEPAPAPVPQRPRRVNPFDGDELPPTDPIPADPQPDAAQPARPKRPRRLTPEETQQETEVQAAEAPQPDPVRKPQKPKPSWTEDKAEDDTPPWETGEEKLTVEIPQKPRKRPKPEPEPEPEPKPRKPYVFPAYKLLSNPAPEPENQDAEDALRARALEETLDSFHIPAKVRRVVHGPAVSRFEVEIANGIKVDKVTGLDKNIAMKLAASDVRIQAPIPGKSLVGVEVPNRNVTPVVLREVLESPAMQKARSPLVAALGKDIAGEPIICDLEKMPHLLIAGQTGSGKSVCINAIIMTLLYRTTPEEVRLILIDPKVVELSVYNGVPHLLLPVVNDPRKAAGALQWAVNEMMDRYQRFARRGVRNISGYNASLEEDEEPMTRIVIIVDELADLMLACRKEVEAHIQRLTQLARAAGIHLVVATQRPSVDVITGVIKSNIPSRIAFKVSSIVDSRTILDYQGAEKLLGKGDMLFNPTGAFTPVRIQGCFLSDQEVQSICDDVRAHNDVCYDSAVVDMLNSISEGPDMPDMNASSDKGDDGMLLQAVEMTVLDGQVSTSLIQRRLRLGYARAGRLVDRMEELGIVSPKDGAKPRQCLITREQFEQMKETGLLEE